MRKTVSFLAVCMMLSVLVNCAATAQSAADTEIAKTNEKAIYLTFDDGPTDSTTPYILDVLKKENVRATFFVIGKQIRGRENIIRRERAEGHKIAIHTYSHEYKKIYADKPSLLLDIDKCRLEILRVLPDWKEKLYRFPGGSSGICEELRTAVKDAGWNAVDWNASAEDAVRPHASAEELYQSVLQSSENKNHIVLLMHDGVGYKATIQCLHSVIKHFKAEGYSFNVL